MSWCSHIILFIPSFLVFYAVIIICNTWIFTAKPTVKCCSFYFSHMYFFKFRRKKNISNLPVYLPCLALLIASWKSEVSTCYHFPSGINFFFHSWSTDLLVMNSLSSHLSEKVFILPISIFWVGGYVCWGTVYIL